MCEIPSLDTEAAIALVMELIAIPGRSGEEGAIARAVQGNLLGAGIAPACMAIDEAHRRSPFGGEQGNLVVNLPGRGALASASRLLLSAHMDTVPICAGAVPRREGNRLVPEASTTALGADNRSGCAAIVTLIRELRRQELDHRPLSLIFFVQEEVGLVGSRELDGSLLAPPAFGINVDGGLAREICHGAIGGIKWQLTIEGSAAHAGVHPEEGISAAAVLARGLGELVAGGWHGAVRQDGREGKANIGMLHGGESTNVVMPRLVADGECRSHDPEFLEVLLARYRQAFAESAAATTNVHGKAATAELVERNRYPAFVLDRASAPVRCLLEALGRLGLEPIYRVSNGAQDANNLNRLHAIPTVTVGAGAHLLHTTDEYLAIDEYLEACRLLLACAVQAE